MTRMEFVRGWLLLTTQPWGKAYRTQTLAPGEPNTAEIQSEFYYKAFEKQDADLWFRACQLQATGEHWPSIELLKSSMRDLRPAPPKVEQISTGGPFITKEEFGVNLFETIKSISGIRALEEQIAVAIHQEKPHKLDDLKARRLALKEILANQLPILTHDEMDQILARYPFVVDL